MKIPRCINKACTKVTANLECGSLLPLSYLLTQVVLLAMLSFTACQTARPKIGDVWMEQRTHLVGPADENWFLRDRASRLTTAAQPLPESQVGRIFWVTWRGKDVTAMKFEYRLVNTPETIRVKTIVKPFPRTVTFLIPAPELAGSEVSAWRVSLWRDDYEIAAKKSALW